MRWYYHSLSIVSIFLIALFISTSSAFGALSADDPAIQKCALCHKGDIAKFIPSTHAKVFAAGKGMVDGLNACEQCHGLGDTHIANARAHMVDKQIDRSLIRSLGKNTPLSPDELNGVCLGCHQDNKNQMLWNISTHAANGVTCISCHTGPDAVLPIKVINDAPTPSIGANPVTTLCGSCHTQKRASMMRTSHMPIREGKLACDDCHDPHGGVGPASLRQQSVNDNCYSCHAEKRGPMVWEHPPVRENCTTCHDSHGTNNPKMLKAREPYLCQQCHMANYHPSTLYNADGLPSTGATAKQSMYHGCTNCHPMVHGSNHPSGPRFTR
jgi:DmsE family decaheme c-type cytochrome